MSYRDNADKAILELARHIRAVVEDFSIKPVDFDDVHVTMPLALYRQVEIDVGRQMGSMLTRDANAGNPVVSQHSFVVDGVRFVGR